MCCCSFGLEHVLSLGPRSVFLAPVLTVFFHNRGSGKGLDSGGVGQVGDTIPLPFIGTNGIGTGKELDGEEWRGWEVLQRRLARTPVGGVGVGFAPFGCNDRRAPPTKLHFPCSDYDDNGDGDVVYCAVLCCPVLR